MLLFRGLGEATEPESRWSRPITIGALNSPRAYHLVEGEAQLVTHTQTDPANARRQTLEANPLAGHIKPIMQMLVFKEDLFDLSISFVDVFRVARQRHPTERANATAEQWTYVS